jgi:hypothetical protein
MEISFGAALAGLLIFAEPQQEVVVTTGPHSVGTEYHRFAYESACGSNVFQARFRNGREGNGRVDHVSVNGRAVKGAAETLQIRAARRWIEKIEIMNCGKDPQDPVFVGVMKMGEAESRLVAMRHTLLFRLTWVDGKGWLITVD